MWNVKYVIENDGGVGDEIERMIMTTTTTWKMRNNLVVKVGRGIRKRGVVGVEVVVVVGRRGKRKTKAANDVGSGIEVVAIVVVVVVVVVIVVAVVTMIQIGK